MSDITAAPAATISGIKLPGLGDLGALMKRGDLALAIGVLAILVVLILPLPPMLLDSGAGHLDHHFGADPDDGAVHPHAAGILRPSRPCC